MPFLEFDPSIPIYFNKGRKIKGIIAMNYYRNPIETEADDVILRFFQKRKCCSFKKLERVLKNRRKSQHELY